MKFDLEPAKKVLRSFLSDIVAIEKIRQGISAPVCTSFNIKDREPDFSDVEFVPELDSFWMENNAYMWIYAEVQYYSELMHHPKNNIVPDYYLQSAQPIYQDWYDEEKEVIYRGTIIPLPRDVNLNDYLTFLASCIQDGNEKRSVWIKSLKSFLKYLRDDMPLELQGTLDCILPYKMKIRRAKKLQRIQGVVKESECGIILRNAEETAYPIDILAAAEIQQNLAKTVLEGPSHGQRTAAEALGLAWLCHAVGSARLMTQEKIVRATSLNALKVVNLDLQSRLPLRHFVTIQTFHGFKDVPISKTLYDFLVELPRAKGNDSIFSKPLSTLLRTLYEKGVDQSERAKSLGKITFHTFMSQSTHWYGHRPGQIKTKTT